MERGESRGCGITKDRAVEAIAGPCKKATVQIRISWLKFIPVWQDLGAARRGEAEGGRGKVSLARQLASITLYSLPRRN